LNGENSGETLGLLSGAEIFIQSLRIQNRWIPACAGMTFEKPFA
jgi:hypothetical protein